MPADPPVKTSPEALRAEIARARAQVISSAVALREEVALRVDWRAWVRRHPGWCLAGAFTVGLLIGCRKK
ncbi:MAG: hypothetical protein ACOZIN_21425 [Myxococcota bacterium]